MQHNGYAIFWRNGVPFYRDLVVWDTTTVYCKFVFSCQVSIVKFHGSAKGQNWSGQTILSTSWTGCVQIMTRTTNLKNGEVSLKKGSSHKETGIKPQQESQDLKFYNKFGNIRAEKDNLKNKIESVK